MVVELNCYSLIVSRKALGVKRWSLCSVLVLSHSPFGVGCCSLIAIRCVLIVAHISFVVYLLSFVVFLLFVVLLAVRYSLVVIQWSSIVAH